MHNRLIALLISTIGSFTPVIADLDIDTTLQRPTMIATRIQNAISVDGNLSEPEWQRPGMTQFTQRDPVEGAPASEKTEVWIIYDDAALYVAARLHDSSPDSISTRIGRRDSYLNSDWFWFSIDSYHDRQTGYYFAVNPSGSILDGTLYNDSWSDDSWDGVWETKTSVDNSGWTVEMRIPYSQIRFPQLSEYVWGVNFCRDIQRKNESDYLVMVPKKESGFVSRFADLTGIHDIDPPRKLEILPYFASSGQFLQHEDGDPFNDGNRYDHHLGVDVKLGLGSNLTLNATINPDFGQVEVDPAVVNLTQYETFFQEKRPFFIEGSNFFNFGYGGANNNWGFNFGNPDYFYSRRIGKPPRIGTQHEGFTDMPDRTTILGAGKLTGKIGDNVSIGILQAFTAEEQGRTDSSGVRFSDVVEPFASYSVVRALREFNNGKQAIGIIGTATLRNLDRDYTVDSYNRQSYAVGFDGWTNLDADQTYVLTGWVSGTFNRGTEQRMIDLQRSSLHYFHRPDAGHLDVDSSITSLSGYASRLAINKQKGNFYLNTALGLISPGFNSNDLGFMFRTDIINSHLVLGYRWFDPDGTFRRKSVNAATFRSYTFAGERIGEGYFLFYNAQFMNYWGCNGNFFVNRAVLDNRNTRGGPLMKTTNYYGSDFSIYTDERNPMVIDLGTGGGRSESGGYIFYLNPGITWKPSSGVSLRISPSFVRDVTMAQWIDNIDDATATGTYGTRYMFGKIDQKELSASIRLDWTFSPALSLQLYMQPLISVGTYGEFKELRQPSTYTFNRYGENGSTLIHVINDEEDYYEADPDGPGAAPSFRFDNPNFNFKSLRGNAVLRWEYLPGSALYFVWTQQRTNTDNAGDFEFGRDYRSLLSSRGDNVFLVKATYWWNP